MYTSLLFIATIGYVAAIPAPQVISAATDPVFLGRPCTLSSQCQGGAQCYAVNSNLIATCGGFQAACTSDAQCATNSCVSGACNGPVAPTLPLGTMCYQSTQCANGAACYAVNSMQIPSCGNFQAQCTSNSQCAFNTCVQGFCAGALLSSSSIPSTASSTSPVSSPTSPVSSSTSPVSSSSSVSALASSTSAPRVTSTSTPTSSLSTGSGVATTSVTLTTTVCPCKSMTTAAPLITTTSARGNSTKPTTTQAAPSKYTGGAGEKLRVGIGGAVIAPALAFALMIAI